MTINNEHVMYTPDKKDFPNKSIKISYIEIWQGLPSLPFEESKNWSSRKTLHYSQDGVVIGVAPNALEEFKNNPQAILYVEVEKTPGNTHYSVLTLQDRIFSEIKLEDPIRTAKILNQELLNKIQPVQKETQKPSQDQSLDIRLSKIFAENAYKLRDEYIKDITFDHLMITQVHQGISDYGILRLSPKKISVYNLEYKESDASIERREYPEGLLISPNTKRGNKLFKKGTINDDTKQLITQFIANYAPNNKNSKKWPKMSADKKVDLIQDLLVKLERDLKDTLGK